jgi:DNA-binding MarR family transcriptional regulator
LTRLAGHWDLEAGMKSQRRPPEAAGKSPGLTTDLSVGSLPAIEDRVSFQVHCVNAKLAQVSNKVFRFHQVDLISSRILAFLLEREEMRVGELVELMVLPQSTISHQLQRLDKRKLLRRRRTRQDNRSVAVVLTPLGRHVAQECSELSRSVYQRMTENLSDKDLRQLRLLLGKMFNALDNFEPLPGSAADAAEDRSA